MRGTGLIFKPSSSGNEGDWVLRVPPFGNRMPSRPVMKRPPAARPTPRDEPFFMACFVFCIAQLVYLAASFVLNQWLVDPQGRGIPADFVNVWAAGKLVLSGFPDWAYIW